MVVELLVDKLVQGGDGLATLDGMKVFVPFSAPQERVRARIVTRKRDYAVAEIEEIIEPSPLRISAPCPYYGACGGCQLQHINYQGQLVVKKLYVNEALQRIGQVFVPVRNVTTEAEPWHYRNKTQYPVGMTGDGMAIGFFRRGTHELLDVPTCLLHPVEFDRLREAIRAILVAAGETGYDETKHTGNVRHVVLRQGTRDGGLLAIVVTRTPQFDPRAAELIAEQPGVTGVVHSVVPARTNRIMGSQATVLSGSGHLNQSVLGKSFRVSAPSFFQVNIQQAEELCRKILKHVAPNGDELLLDLYSGVGMISLLMAPFVQRVTAIEADVNAVEDAKANALDQAVRNVEFICGDVNRELSRVASTDVVILDPPRKGCPAETLRQIAKLRPKRIVYVSCNPATLARDLATLEQSGYTTHEIEPVDMFPQTFHVEVIARLGPLGSTDE
jgi:23S rRNA (uracil1939-C5)-methyltransferase